MKKTFELKRFSLSRETLLSLSTPNPVRLPDETDRSISGVKNCVCCA